MQLRERLSFSLSAGLSAPSSPPGRQLGRLTGSGWTAALQSKNWIRPASRDNVMSAAKLRVQGIGSSLPLFGSTSYRRQRT